MASFWMTLFKSKWTNTVVDDGWVHPLAETLPSLDNYPSSIGSTSILRASCVLKGLFHGTQLSLVWYSIGVIGDASLGLDHIFIQLGPVPPMSLSLSGLPHDPCSHLCGNSPSLGTNVIIKLYKIYKYASWHQFHSTPNHLSHWTPLACEGTPSINLAMPKVMSTWIFVLLI